jgi:hypothetical protein
MPQTLYQAVERLTRQGERHAFLLNIIQQDPAVAKTVLALQAEAAERARFEELGRKAAEQGLLTPGT